MQVKECAHEQLAAWETSGNPARLEKESLARRTLLLVACSSYLKPSLTDSDEPIRTDRLLERPRFFLVEKFNELQTWLINPLDGITDAAPDPASTKGLLCVEAATRSVSQKPCYIKNMKNGLLL